MTLAVAVEDANRNLLDINAVANVGAEDRQRDNRLLTTHTTPTEVFTVWHILLFDQKSKLAPVLYGKVLWQTHSTLRSVVPLAMFIFEDNHFVGCFPSGLLDTLGNLKGSKYHILGVTTS